MALSDQIAHVAANVFFNTDYFGETITHTPFDGEPVDLVGNFSLMPTLPDINDGREGLQRTQDGRLFLALSTENVSCGQKPSKFTIRGEDWIAVGITKEISAIVVNVRRVSMFTMRRPHVSNHP